MIFLPKNKQFYLRQLNLAPAFPQQFQLRLNSKAIYQKLELSKTIMMKLNLDLNNQLKIQTPMII